MSDGGWIGVDLDGTLAEYHGWQGAEHIGKPIGPMVRRVLIWLKAGNDVRIFTARVGPRQDPTEADRARAVIEAWCLEQFGQVLPITATKDYGMVELWDDRCVQLITNTGERADEVKRRRR